MQVCLKRTQIIALQGMLLIQMLGCCVEETRGRIAHMCVTAVFAHAHRTHNRSATVGCAFSRIYHEHSITVSYSIRERIKHVPCKYTSSACNARLFLSRPCKKEVEESVFARYKSRTNNTDGGGDDDDNDNNTGSLLPYGANSNRCN